MIPKMRQFILNLHCAINHIICFLWNKSGTSKLNLFYVSYVNTKWTEPRINITEDRIMKKGLCKYEVW